jgi:hypothetical protein
MGFNSDSNDKSSQLTPFLKTIGNNCNRPAYDDTKSALTAELERVNVAKTKSGVKLRAEQPGSYAACPPMRDEIGISMWNLVHSMMPSFVMGCIMCCFGKGVYV